MHMAWWFKVSRLSLGGDTYVVLVESGAVLQGYGLNEPFKIPLAYSCASLSFHSVQGLSSCNGYQWRMLDKNIYVCVNGLCISTPHLYPDVVTVCFYIVKVLTNKSLYTPNYGIL